jgi:hypothetical protein
VALASVVTETHAETSPSDASSAVEATLKELLAVCGADPAWSLIQRRRTATGQEVAQAEALTPGSWLRATLSPYEIDARLIAFAAIATLHLDALAESREDSVDWRTAGVLQCQISSQHIETLPLNDLPEEGHLFVAELIRRWGARHAD